MPESATLTVDRNIPVPMRDGTILYADVFRPAAPGKYPTILRRTPYKKEILVDPAFILRAAAEGYVVFIQDVRGRYASEGEFRCFVNERDDGYDTLEFLLSQPWCDGNVGSYGTSYNGLTQWQAAMSLHPALKAIVPGVTASNYHDGWTYQGGAFELSFSLSWTMTNLAPDTVAKHGSLEDKRWILDEIDKLSRLFERLPLTDHPVLQKFAPYYIDWLAHPVYDEFWASFDVETMYNQMTLPALNIGGWYDIFLQGTLNNFAGMRAKAPTAEARAAQRLLIGPWNHPGMRAGNPIGETDFGIRSTGGVIDVDSIHLRWYDRWLRGNANGVDEEPPVRIFVMGANQWRHEHEWPLARTDYQDWYFHSGGKANTLNGDGLLSPEAPNDEPPDSFLYNPRNPVPSRGGAMCCNPIHSHGGSYDQRPIETREDVLVYTTPALEREIEVTGPVKVVLHVASSAPDTDFTAKLVDVHPCGCAMNLTDGILRARYRRSMSEPMLLTPNEVTELEIDLWSTSNVFLQGHRIRVEISSSNFPRFDRNPNTGELPGRSPEMVSALQTVHHSSSHPSRIVLPVIEPD